MIFFVYVDYTLDENLPFYVGKGQIARLQKRERNAYWKNIAVKHGWRREIMLATKDESFAFEEEKRRIAELSTFEDGTPGRWGANLTKGGEGISGWKHSKETCERMSRSRSGANNHQYGKIGILNLNFGKVRSKEIREKFRLNHPMTGKTQSMTTIAKWSGQNNHMYGRKGQLHPRFGKTHTATSREKMRSNAILTWSHVAVIRAHFIAGVSCQALANEFSVSYNAIWKIVHNKTWTTQSPENSCSELA